MLRYRHLSTSLLHFCSAASAQGFLKTSEQVEIVPVSRFDELKILFYLFFIYLFIYFFLIYEKNNCMQLTFELILYLKFVISLTILFLKNKNNFV